MKNRYELTPDGRYAIIYIRCQGYERATIVSVEDLERAKQVPTSWYGDVRPWTMYARACFGNPRQYVYLHRWLMEPDEEHEIDHYDHDGLNNTRDNLREVTPEVNFNNRREHSYGATLYRDYESGCTGYAPQDDPAWSILDDLPF